MKIEDTFNGTNPRLETGESTSLVAKPIGLDWIELANLPIWWILWPLMKRLIQKNYTGPKIEY